MYLVRIPPSSHVSEGTGKTPSKQSFSGSPFIPHCGSLACMAQSGRFALSLRILTVLASEPGTMHTSAEIAESLKESAVMVRRCFLLLHKQGLIEQRKGPHGGARLKRTPKQIGLGDVYIATEGDWLAVHDPAITGLMKRVRQDGMEAMNETTLAQMLKRVRKAGGKGHNGNGSHRNGASHKK